MYAHHLPCVVLLQETHTANESQLKARGSIEGYELIGATYHRHYGTATYIKSNINNAILIDTSSNDMIFTITIDIGGTKIINIYKPPNISWPTEPIPKSNHPATYMISIVTILNGNICRTMQMEIHWLIGMKTIIYI